MRLNILEADLNFRKLQRSSSSSDDLDSLSDYYVASRRAGSNLARPKQSIENSVENNIEKLNQINPRPRGLAALWSRVMRNRNSWQAHDADRDMWQLLAPDNSERIVEIYTDDGTVYLYQPDESPHLDEDPEEIGTISPQAVEFITDLNAPLEVEALFWDELNVIWARSQTPDGN